MKCICVPVVFLIILFILYKCSKRAEYFCADSLKSVSDWQMPPNLYNYNNQEFADYNNMHWDFDYLRAFNPAYLESVAKTRNTDYDEAVINQSCFQNPLDSCGAQISQICPQKNKQKC